MCLAFNNNQKKLLFANLLVSCHKRSRAKLCKYNGIMITKVLGLQRGIVCVAGRRNYGKPRWFYFLFPLCCQSRGPAI